MGKPALVFPAALWLLQSTLLPVSAQVKSPPTSNQASGSELTASSEARNRIVGYTAWDDEYFYIGLQVNKPNLVGRNTAPFSDPLKDDAILISLQTDNDHKTTQRTSHTVTMAVSAVGGFQLYSGEKMTPIFSSFQEIATRLEQIAATEKNPDVEQAKRTALLGSIPKAAVTKKGAPRPDGSLAPGYSLEVGIPWSDLGGKPEPGARMGFHVAAQSVPPSQDSPLLQSLSPTVKGASDLDNPSLWSEVILGNAPSPPVGSILVSPRVLTNRPNINGVLDSGEWNGLSAFSFGERAVRAATESSLTATLAARTRPEYVARPAHPRIPVAAPQEAAPAAAYHPQKVTPVVLARYEYWFQADPRKAAPADRVLLPDKGTALVHHPLDGVGPWFSYDHADWHRTQMVEARRDGVDVLLPVFRGSARDRQLYAEKGLTVLATALEYLRQVGQDYPQIALYLDTNSLIDVFGDRPDLRAPETRAALYAMIRDFYRRIPDPFRYVVALNDENGGRKACPIFLSDGGAFKDLDAAFPGYLRSRFRADFPGYDLIVIGANNFKPKVTLDGYFTDPKEKGLQFDGEGWIKVASIGAGYDTTLTAGPQAAPTVRPRRNGDSYRADWMGALARHPDWILIDGWNGYGVGDEIAPSLEVGYSAADITRVFTRMFAGAAKIGVKFLWHDIPASLLPSETTTVHVRVQNAGQVGWGENNAVTVGFVSRWLQNGQVVAEGPVEALTAPVLAGQNVEIALPVQAARARGVPLAQGNYLLEIGVAESQKKGGHNRIGEANGSATLQVPVQIRAAAQRSPQWAATVVSSDLPKMLETGSVYSVRTVLRNDGTLPWRKADGARVSLRLYRSASSGEAERSAALQLTSSGPHPESRETPVALSDATAELEKDVAPGEEVTVRLLVPIQDTEGKPLPVWSQEDLWTYTARWEVAADHPAGGGGEPVGVSLESSPVSVVDFDFGVRFIADSTPPALPGDRRQPVRLSLFNVGPQIWKRDQVRVGYHWYYQDGTELRWEDETTPIAQDVPPGGRVSDMLAWVTAPPYDGNYFLVWDVKFGDTWGSTAACTRVFEQTLHPIQVVGGRLVFADLSKSYNLDGVTDVDAWTDGDFDGKGHTFPAALLPPFTDTPVVASALWLPSEKTGPESPHRFSFRWGPKDPRAKNFLACQGQRVELGKSSGQCHYLHIVAASTGKDVLSHIKLIFQEPTSFSEDLYALSVSRWDSPATQHEEIAFLSPRVHGRNGIEPGPVALYHYVITIREPRRLVALQLPNEPSIKIAAITLEK
jgi:hypothetical protein